jgi:hypothetical protein
LTANYYYELLNSKLSICESTNGVISFVFGFLLSLATFSCSFSSSLRFCDACFFVGLRTRPKELVGAVNSGAVDIEGTAVEEASDLSDLSALSALSDSNKDRKSERDSSQKGRICNSVASKVGFAGSCSRSTLFIGKISSRLGYCIRYTSSPILGNSVELVSLSGKGKRFVLVKEGRFLCLPVIFLCNYVIIF